MLFPIEIDKTKTVTKIDFAFPPELAASSLKAKNSAIKRFMSQSFGDKKGRRKEWIEYDKTMVYTGGSLLYPGEDPVAPVQPAAEGSGGAQAAATSPVAEMKHGGQPTEGAPTVQTPQITISRRTLVQLGEHQMTIQDLNSLMNRFLLGALTAESGKLAYEQRGPRDFVRRGHKSESTIDPRVRDLIRVLEG